MAHAPHRGVSVNVAAAGGFAPWEPDVVMPAQWRGRVRLDQPEKRLLLAVLEDAVDLVLRPHRAGDSWPPAIAQARAWLAANDLAWPCSFLRICEALELEPTGIRARVLHGGARPPEGMRHQVAGTRTFPVARRTSGRSLADVKGTRWSLLNRG